MSADLTVTVIGDIAWVVYPFFSSRAFGGPFLWFEPKGRL